MDTDEWKLWKTNLPELPSWLELRKDETPTREACLEACERRAFAFGEKEMLRFIAAANAQPYHKLGDKELELVIRVLLECKNSRNAGLPLGENGRRLLRAAEKKSGVATGYLEPFRQLVLAELD